MAIAIAIAAFEARPAYKQAFADQLKINAP